MSIETNVKIPSTCEILPLTGIRAFAATWVLFYHLRPELSNAFPNLSHFWNPFLNQGYLGVDLFFALSGFILSYNYKLVFSRFRVRKFISFLWMRLARIYPVHVFILCLYVFCVLTAKVLSIHLTLPELFSISGLLRNLFLVQAWDVPAVPTWNGPAWSISCEWLAYLFFPIIVSYVLPSKKIFLVSIFLLSAALLIGSPYVFQFPNTSAYAIIRIVTGFSMGMVTFEFFRLGFGSKLPWDGIILTCLTLIFCLPLYLQNSHNSMFLVAPLFSVMILGLAYSNSLFARLCSLKWFLIGGYLSYSLYMIHELILLVYRKFLRTDLFAGSDIFSQLSLPVVVLICWVAALLLYRFVETPARGYMRAVSKRFIVSGD